MTLTFLSCSPYCNSCYAVRHPGWRGSNLWSQWVRSVISGDQHRTSWEQT